MGYRTTLERIFMIPGFGYCRSPRVIADRGKPHFSPYLIQGIQSLTVNQEEVAGVLFGNPIMKIAERRIQEAQERGEFENLPGQGKLLKFEDDSYVPEELRIAYKILKNADCLPPELEAKKEIRQMEDLLEGIPDEKERYKLIKKINYQIMKLNMMGKKSPLLEEKEIYYTKVVDKIAKK